MGTRSTIAIEFADGTVEQVYCHWDGYLSNNGKILAEHYSDPFVLQKLIAMGSISSLGKVIGKKHPFSPAYNETDLVKKAKVQAKLDEAKAAGATTFHTRDRGEDLCVSKFKDFADYKANHQYEEFEYILRQVSGKAVWFVADHSDCYVTLSEAFDEAEEEEVV